MFKSPAGKPNLGSKPFVLKPGSVKKPSGFVSPNRENEEGVGMMSEQPSMTPPPGPSQSRVTGAK